MLSNSWLLKYKFHDTKHVTGNLQFHFYFLYFHFSASELSFLVIQPGFKLCQLQHLEFYTGPLPSLDSWVPGVTKEERPALLLLASHCSWCVWGWRCWTFVCCHFLHLWSHSLPLCSHEYRSFQSTYSVFSYINMYPWKKYIDFLFFCINSTQL